MGHGLPTAARGRLGGAPAETEEGVRAELDKYADIFHESKIDVGVVA